MEGQRAYPVLTNDLERAALEEAPELAERVGRIRAMLVREGARMAALSGSGSAFFGLYDDPRGARRAQAALSAAGFRAFRGRTLTLDQFRKTWSQSLVRRGRAGRTR